MQYYTKRVISTIINTMLKYVPKNRRQECIEETAKKANISLEKEVRFKQKEDNRTEKLFTE